MADAKHTGRLAYLFDDDHHSGETPSSGVTALPPAEAIKQAIHALQAFQKTKNEECINEAVELAQHAANSTPSADDNLAAHLTTLGAMQQHRYKATGDKSSLDNTVIIARRAVEVSREDDENQDMYVRNLAAALRYRHSESGDEKHLEVAIAKLQHVAASVVSKSRNWALESILGFQKLYFEKTSDVRHLDEATHTTKLLLGQVENSDRAELLYNLCDLHDMHLDHSPTVAHLDECIKVCRDILDAIPTEDDRRPAIMHNISVYYTRRYSQNGCLEDLRQAIEFNQMASANTDGHQACAEADVAVRRPGPEMHAVV